jgi:hypothetical protein
MRQVTRKGLMTVAAATGVLAAAGGYAHADSGANGSSSDSPGVLSGNTVQVPVHIPVNVCGNTVDVVGILNPASGNTCANKDGGSHHSDGGSDTGGGSHTGDHSSGGGSHASGHTSDSPGIGSGNLVQVPIDVPVNVCGNSIDLIGVGNAATDADCGNGGHATPPGGHETTPPADPEHPVTPTEPTDPVTPSTPPSSAQPNHPGTQTVSQPKGSAQLAHTGSDVPVGLVLPVGAGALLAGAVLYRKARASV